MTEQVLTEAQTQDPRDFHRQVAHWIAGVCSLALLALSIWCSINLLNWAMHERELRSTQTATSDVTLEMRERQLGCLTKNIYYEAGGEPFEGKVAVAQVTLNRAASSAFPDDICKVIYQKNKTYEKVVCQFSWVCENVAGFKPVNRREYEESLAVAKKVLLEGFRLPGLKDALYFHGDYINPGWRRERVAHIGRHIFYR
jgi:spore germination cell wall hydrolase CwlJ-like protein